MSFGIICGHFSRKFVKYKSEYRESVYINVLINSDVEWYFNSIQFSGKTKNMNGKEQRVVPE